MIPILTFSLIAAGLVFLAGKKDAACDPRLTMLMLALLAAFPLMAALLPEIAMIPAAGGAPDAVGLPWGTILLLIWALGFMVAIVRMVCAALALQRWRTRSSEVERVDGVVIRELQDLRGPVAAGVRHPVIFVPSSWSDWPREYRRVVLEHEMAHHRRRDPLWRLFAEFACAVHWYHPLVRWMARRFIIQCEFACDAIVLSKGIDPKTYANVLCDFAAEHPPSFLAPAMAESSSLESRVRRMLKPARLLSGRALAGFGALGVLTACGLSMVGRKADRAAGGTAEEVELRLSANPFPGEN